MSIKHKYYIVEASALPEVFVKVAEAKRLLATGEASTVNEATRMTDISRSAFYKYRDSVLPFQNMANGRIITFQFLIQDEPGLLANMLDIFPISMKFKFENDINKVRNTLEALEQQCKSYGIALSWSGDLQNYYTKK